MIDHGPADAMAHMTAVDGFSVFVGTVVIVSALLTLLLSSDYLVRRGIESRPEYVALLLFSVAGMLTMAAANDLIVVFVALEVLSIPLYVLAAYDRRRARSLEAGIKYFVLGAFSSAIFLYGVALVYGATGTTSLEGIQGFLATHVLADEGTLLAGMVLLLVGLGFKIAAVPFHMWTPDVYEGAPSPVTGFMASATKAAGFAALLRVLFTGLAQYQSDWRNLLFVLAVLTLLGGSIAALRQTDLKRLLAYSSIAHAGYVLIGVQAGTARGLQSALVYLLVYSFMTIGAFALVTALGGRDDTHSIEDLHALGRRRPVIAALLAFFLLAQAGIPPTAGFIAKLGVFGAAAEAHSYALADRRRGHVGHHRVLLPAGHPHDVRVGGRAGRAGRARGGAADGVGRPADRDGPHGLRARDDLDRDPADGDHRLRAQRHADHLIVVAPRRRPVRGCSSHRRCGGRVPSGPGNRAVHGLGAAKRPDIYSPGSGVGLEGPRA